MKLRQKTKDINKNLSSFCHFMHHNFLSIILVSYFTALIYPVPGVALRAINVGSLDCFGSSIKLSLPFMILSFLLFNAGLGVKLKNFKKLLVNPMLLIGASSLKIIIPVIMVLITALILSPWPEVEETQNILVGLTILISMPIASATPSWTQNSDGNIALSLGMIYVSTILSPLITPLIIQMMSFITINPYREDLHYLSTHGISNFLIFAAVIPSLLGILVQVMLGESKSSYIKPLMKTINTLFLITLMYSNASISLPQIFLDPDPDYHLIIVIITVTMCLALFNIAPLLSKFFKAGKEETIALTFAMGMNNNAAGLILASMALPQYPGILLPLIFYNLFQQLGASIITKKYAD